MVGLTGCGGGRMSDAEPLLRVSGLRTWYPIQQGLMQRTVGWVQAATDVGFTIAPGETLALVGESGCGKSTVGRSILRLEQAQEGEVLFEGRDLLALDAPAVRAARQRIQIIFQDPMASLDPRMRIRDQIAEGMESFGIGADESERTERVAALLERVQLDAAAMDRYPHEFSGGQRQRICIARALAVEPRLIVCYESVSALDVSIHSQILNLLRDLVGDRGLAMLFITHDLAVVDFIADRVAVMYLGVIVESGPRAAVLDTPRHPYTQALRAAVPEAGRGKRRQGAALTGEVPSPLAPPSGCRFHTRCPMAKDICRAEVPVLEAVGDGGHAAACHFKAAGA